MNHPTSSAQQRFPRWLSRVRREHEELRGELHRRLFGRRRTHSSQLLPPPLPPPAPSPPPPLQAQGSDAETQVRIPSDESLSPFPSFSEEIAQALREREDVVEGEAGPGVEMDVARSQQQTASLQMQTDDARLELPGDVPTLPRAPPRPRPPRDPWPRDPSPQSRQVGVLVEAGVRRESHVGVIEDVYDSPSEYSTDNIERDGGAEDAAPEAAGEEEEEAELEPANAELHAVVEEQTESLPAIRSRGPAPRPPRPRREVDVGAAVHDAIRELLEDEFFFSLMPTSRDVEDGGQEASTRIEADGEGERVDADGEADGEEHREEDATENAGEDTAEGVEENVQEDTGDNAEGEINADADAVHLDRNLRDAMSEVFVVLRNYRNRCEQLEPESERVEVLNSFLTGCQQLVEFLNEEIGDSEHWGDYTDEEEEHEEEMDDAGMWSDPDDDGGLDGPGDDEGGWWWRQRN